MHAQVSFAVASDTTLRAYVLIYIVTVAQYALLLGPCYSNLVDMFYFSEKFKFKQGSPAFGDVGCVNCAWTLCSDFG